MAMLQLSIVLCLLAYSRPSTGQVLGDVFIYTNNYTFDPFPDLPADFGPEVPEEGIDGWLVLADPEDACQPFTIPPIDDTWVALISRSQQQHPTNCTFDVKVRHAEQAGASAAIVYDDVYEALIIMSKPRDHPEPGIPAVFVSEKAGIIMKKLMTPGQTRVRIVAVSASAWMSLVMSAFLGFLALTVVLATFYVMRSWSVWLGRTRGRRTQTDLGAGPYTTAGQPLSPGGLPACVIRALPVLVYEGKPASSRNRQQRTGSSRELSTAKQDAADQSLETSLDASVTGGGADVFCSSVASPEQHEGHVIRQKQQHGASPGASFPGSPQDQLQACQENMSSSSSAPAALPDCCIVRCEAPGGNPTVDRPSEVATAAAESETAVSPGAVAVTAAAAAAGDVGSPSVDQIYSLSSGASTPSMITDDDYDGPDQQILAGSGTAAAAAGIVTGGPVGARGGATRRTCVVCLERYQDGDKIRVLPCQHRFHVKCIDPWLASRRLCPVCKHDASQPAVHLLQAAAGADCTVAVGVGGSAAGSRQGTARNGIGPRWLLRGATEWLGRLSSRFRSVVSNDSSSSSNRPDRDEGVSQPTHSALVSFSQQRQLLSAAAYAAAAAEAAENGLGAPSGSRSVAAVGPDIAPTAAASSQLPPLQWRRQRQRANRQLRQASSRQQRHPQADELLTPLLVSPSHSSSSSSSHRRVRSNGISAPVDFGSSRSQSVREDSRSVPAGAWGVLLPVSSPPVAIPQLTPVQSDASSAGSRTPSLR